LVCTWGRSFVLLHIQPASLQAPNKAVILSEALRRCIAKQRALWRGVEGPRGCLSYPCARSFSPSKPHLADTPRSFPWTEDIKWRSCTRSSWLKSLEPHRQDTHSRGPSTPRHKVLRYAIHLPSASLRMTALFGACKLAGWIRESTKDRKSHKALRMTILWEF
jgi:hypothetical protein